MKDAGLGAALFSDVDANPTDKNAEAGVTMYREGGFDGVIAFGGGSTLDTLGNRDRLSSLWNLSHGS